MIKKECLTFIAFNRTSYFHCYSGNNKILSVFRRANPELTTLFQNVSKVQFMQIKICCNIENIRGFQKQKRKFILGIHKPVRCKQKGKRENGKEKLNEKLIVCNVKMFNGKFTGYERNSMTTHVLSYKLYGRNASAANERAKKT